MFVSLTINGCCYCQLIVNVLKIECPSDLSSALRDGVLLCHLANNVRQHSVPKVHVPSPTMVTLSNSMLSTI